MHISWDPPQPRAGLAGRWDRFVGPGATRWEFFLQLAVPTIACAGLTLHAASRGLGWSGWQLGVAAMLAFDLFGGVTTNATSTAKRWYHRTGQGFVHHMGFVLVHVAHLLLVAWLYLSLDWTFVAITAGYLLAASAVTCAAPLYLQRPLAITAYAGGLVIAAYGVAPIPGLEWFLPIFYLKLLVSHLIKEAPFRPAAGG